MDYNNLNAAAVVAVTSSALQAQTHLNQTTPKYQDLSPSSMDTAGHCHQSGQLQLQLQHQYHAHQFSNNQNIHHGHNHSHHSHLNHSVHNAHAYSAHSAHNHNPFDSDLFNSALSNHSNSSKKQLDKDSDEYRKRRERNNVAVRKSREKAKLRSRETERRVSELSKENQIYRSQYEELRREFNVLKSLLIKTGLTEQVIDDEAQRHQLSTVASSIQTHIGALEVEQWTDVNYYSQVV